MHVARIVYDKYKRGDSISNKELNEGVKFFFDVSEKLSVMGPVFTLAAHEAAETYWALIGFQEARKKECK